MTGVTNESSFHTLILPIIVSQERMKPLRSGSTLVTNATEPQPKKPGDDYYYCDSLKRGSKHENYPLVVQLR